MRNWLRMAVVVAVLVLAALTIFVAPASAGGHIQPVSGVAFPNANDDCPEPPPGYEGFTDLPPIQLTGNLDACLYTKIDQSKDFPGGGGTTVYTERGREIVVGCVQEHGHEQCGTFETRYLFISKWRELFVDQISGGCVHPIVSGTGDFAGSGLLVFRDNIQDIGGKGVATSYSYWGVVTVANDA
jgi:hypothetical protein